MWGLVPAYWKTLVEIPAAEVTAWRALWAAVLGWALVAATGNAGAVRAALVNPRLLGPILLSASLLAVNWFVFIYAVETGRVSHTSLGYYVNPLVSVALGRFVLRESLRPAQKGAVAIAAAGVAWWTVSLGGLPWIAAALALSFALYGLVRKLVPVPSLVGFGLEMSLLVPLALIGLATRPELALADAGPARHAWVALSGVVTAAPLVCFASAARRLPLVVLGLFQYLAPSLTLTLAVLVYGEPFARDHAVSFGCVALALVLFSVDSFAATRVGAEADPVR